MLAAFGHARDDVLDRIDYAPEQRLDGKGIGMRHGPVSITIRVTIRARKPREEPCAQRIGLCSQSRQAALASETYTADLAVLELAHRVCRVRSRRDRRRGAGRRVDRVRGAVDQG